MVLLGSASPFSSEEAVLDTTGCSAGPPLEPCSSEPAPASCPPPPPPCLDLPSQAFAVGPQFRGAAAEAARLLRVPELWVNTSSPCCMAVPLSVVLGHTALEPAGLRLPNHLLWSLWKVPFPLLLQNPVVSAGSLLTLRLLPGLSKQPVQFYRAAPSTGTQAAGAMRPVGQHPTAQDTEGRRWNSTWGQTFLPCNPLYLLSYMQGLQNFI